MFKGVIICNFLYETPLAQIASSRGLNCLYYNLRYANFAPHQNVLSDTLLIEKLNKENKMRKKLNNPNIANTILWAAAILSAAILDAPQFLTIIILPVCGLLSIINVKRCS